MPASTSPIDAARLHTITIEGLGAFTLRRPDGNDKIEIGKHMSLITEGVPVYDNATAALVRCRALLEVVGERMPDGYSFATTFEDELDAVQLVEEFYTWINSFRRSRTTPAGDPNP